MIRAHFDGPEPSAISFACWFVTLFIVAQLPLYAIEYIDVADWPNHLARMYIIQHWAESQALQTYYVLHKYAIAPNLPLDAVIPVLSKVVDTTLAFKIFASITVLIFTSGCVALSHALTGRLQYWALGALLFAYNAMFLYGLFNYLWGAGVAFWLLAMWIRTEHWPWGIRLAAFSSGVLVLYLCHLSALGIYALAVVGWQISMTRAPPRVVFAKPLVTLLQFVPAAAIHLLQFSPTGAQFPLSFGGPTLETIVIRKMLFFLMAPGLTISGYKFGWILGPVLAGVVYIAWRKNLVTIAPKARSIACLLAIAVLLLPMTGLGSALVDVRLLPALIAVVWCGMSAIGTAAQGRTVAVLMATGVLLTTALTAQEWLARDIEYRNAREVLKVVPQGSKVATVLILTHGSDTVPIPISPHIAGWSVVDRHTFISNLYARPFYPGWVGFRAEYSSLASRARNIDPGTEMPSYQSIKDAFDYVLVIGDSPRELAKYAPESHTVYESPWMRLLRPVH
jgi:hypothetical protein